VETLPRTVLFIVEVLPVRAGISASNLFGHRDSPRRAPEVCLPALNPSRERRPPSNSRAAAGTRWDRVRLNRLIGSIPVAPTLALAGPWVTRHREKPGDALSFIDGLAQHPAGLLLHPLIDRALDGASAFARRHLRAGSRKQTEAAATAGVGAEKRRRQGRPG
jgi:hypothetical protein